ncbi:glycosyltransferase family 2 protein [Acinetobacter sp. ANC 3791]|uniref:glycosyltransferase family 2 protein n=1 Tax=Acinetobacter sp. ANC 3791 TaxID=2529836 RepID=UPI00103A4F71|nr:glycosyltransferase family 2 protein [Acinetobacter sp. ANC 3791]TCB84894.1 glycosyltransferase family 2 protein [Acinetobacter sp. ANC 3791]
MEQVKVGAIIVTFNPKIFPLSKLIHTLKQQAVEIIIIDNNSENRAELDAIKHIYLECLSQNMGIATAQNIGIKKVIALDVEYVVFFDQDSEVDSNFIENIMKSYIQVKNTIDPMISMIGPKLLNIKENYYYKMYKLNNFGFKEKIDISNIILPQRVDCLISSGSFLSLDRLKEVGEMKDSYFIDYVDIEWSFRHLSQGYHLYVAHNVTMKHQIGEGNISLPFGKRIMIHPPSRRYYRVRNSFFLLKESYIPKIYALNEIVGGLIYQLCIIGYCKKQKKEQINALFRAVRDGLRFFFKHT